MKKLVVLFYTGIQLFISPMDVYAQVSKPVKHSSLSVLNGAWISVPSVNAEDRSMEHSLYFDGFVTNIIRDSSGTWKDLYSGTYEIDGNLYKQKLLYSTISDRMGVTHWQEFKIKGDTLYLTYFKKLIDASGRDITSEYKPFLNKYVRIKR